MLHHAEALYESMPGWTEDLGDVRSEDDLPRRARDYLEFISDYIGVPIVADRRRPGPRADDLDARGAGDGHGARRRLSVPAARAPRLPVPGGDIASIVAPAPVPGEGSWAGAPSATLDDDGAVVLAYRVRSPDERGGAVVLAREDAGRWTTLARLTKARFGAASLERPALVRTAEGGWRLYVSCATPKTKHWRIDVLDADDPAALAAATRAPPSPAMRASPSRTRWCAATARAGERGSAVIRSMSPARRTGCTRAPPRATTAWSGAGTRRHARRAAGHVGRPRRARHRRPADGRIAYDGRATKEENFRERTGLAERRAEPVSDARYLDVLALPGGGYRLFYEAPLPDGSHELRTELGGQPG